MDFQAALKFLSEYRWIYDFPVTSFIGLRVWERMPPEWLEVLSKCSTEELNSIPYGRIKDEWPSSLQRFVKQSLDLSIQREISASLKPIELKSSHRKGMSPKKIHEVRFMAGIVHDICLNNGCSDVIDVGSGLGYLSIALSEQFGYNMLGLESVKSRSHGASDRASSHNAAFSAVEFELADNQESRLAFEELIVERSPNRKWCMMGLHCCGDLTPTMLRVFVQSPNVQCTVVLSCCYHRMSSKLSSSSSYTQFPMSIELQEQMTKGHWSANTFALRLAAQETRTRWLGQTQADHEYHSKNVAYRSLVELSDLKLEKRHRKIARPSHFKSFGTYLDHLLQRTTVTGGDVDQVHCRNVLHDLHAKHKEAFASIEPFTCLQVTMQPVLEAVILQDRLMFLKQHNNIQAKVIPIFDENLSPRNLAIVAWKEDPK